MSVAPADLAILAVYLVGVVVFGLWAGRGAKSLAEYLVGGRNLPWWVILASIVATETSTVTFLSIPGFAFGRDLTWLQIALGFVVGRLAVAAILLPHYFRGGVMTAYEVLRDRFGGAAQRTASALFLVTRTLADGLRLFLSALVLQEMTGLDLPWAVAILGVATIAYTYSGGLTAVLWTDLVQFVVYLGGGIAAFAVVLDRLPGGWEGLVAMGDAAGKLRVLDLGLDPTEPYGLWAGLVGGVFLSLGSHGVDQMEVQRYLAARSLRDARRALSLSGVVAFAQFALFLLIGVGLWAFYTLAPPAEAFGRDDRVFARFILTELPTGLVGLLLGAIFAAAMSTLSSSLNSCATVAANDLVFPLSRRKLGERAKLRTTRWLTAGFGALQIAVGVGGLRLEASVVSAVLGIAAFTTGIVLGVFFLGLFTRRVGQRAALAGLWAGLAGMSWVYFATSLAWPWFAFAGSALTFAAGWAASWAWPRREAGAAAEPAAGG